MAEYNLTVLEGDGIGPEIVREAIKVLTSIGFKYSHKFNLNYAPFGAKSYFETGNAFPEDSKKKCLEADCVIKGPVGLDYETMSRLESQDISIEDMTITVLRKDLLQSYVGFRPARLSSRYAEISSMREDVIGDGIDIMMMREMLGGLYFGKKVEGRSNNWEYAMDECAYSGKEVRRFAKACYDEARKTNSHLTIVHKKNVMATGRLWNHVFHEMAEEYQDLKSAGNISEMLVDALEYWLGKDPRRFNGILAIENMQGDMISDLLGGIVGSLGLMPSLCTNYETKKAYVEASHGSAPDIAGKNIANPYSMIGSIALMLEKQFNLKGEADDIWDAMDNILADGFRSSEIVTKPNPKYPERIPTSTDKILSTRDFGDEVVMRILGCESK
jgi:3-isopropylmalate dehydrogenase